MYDIWHTLVYIDWLLRIKIKDIQNSRWFHSIKVIIIAVKFLIMRNVFNKFQW